MLLESLSQDFEIGKRFTLFPLKISRLIVHVIECMPVSYTHLTLPTKA